jgi:hypothetical protein
MRTYWARAAQRVESQADEISRNADPEAARRVIREGSPTATAPAAEPRASDATTVEIPEVSPADPDAR